MIREAMFYDGLEGSKVQCFLCEHHCKIGAEQFGLCRVRQNKGGKLYTHAYGEVIAVNIDPVEKKPLYHFLPGSRSLSIATPGCNFQCGFCQNWQISQVSRRSPRDLEGKKLAPEQIVRRAKENGCASISYTYTEPTIFFEYAYDTAKVAKAEGLKNIFVTNGYMTPEALKTIHPYLDACNVDLKSYRDEFYRKVCKARLAPVLKSIGLMKELGIWVEITTLVVPGQNDSKEELSDIARFIVSVDSTIPWHISRFHPDYEFTEYGPTPLETLRQARSVGNEEGLKFIYIGNVPGEESDTNCSQCGETLIRRGTLSLKEDKLKGARCPFCGGAMSGVFS